MASKRETKCLKPIDKASFREVSELPGRNESERIGGPESAIVPEVELASVERRQHGYSKSDRNEYSLRRGGSDSTVTRTCRATGETFLVPERNFLEQGRYYN